MKKLLPVLLCLALCLSLLAGCGDNEGVTIIQTGNQTTVIKGNTITVNGDPYKETVCSQQGFTTWCPEDAVTEWKDGDGFYIGLEGSTSIPYVLIYRHENQQRTPEEYLSNVVAPNMRNNYGSDMIAVGDLKTYDYGGKQLPGILFIYKVGDYKIESLRLAMKVGSDLISFNAKSVSGDDEETLKALDAAVKNFKIGSGSGSSGNSQNTGNSGSKTNVKITPSKAASVTLQTYDNGLFSMQIPQGWTVAPYPQSDYIHYTFMVYDPADPAYMIYFNMKTEGYLSSEQERQWYGSMYPDTVFAQLPALDPRTAEKFYSVFTYAMSLNNLANYTFPQLNNFTVVEQIGYNMLGGDILRATCSNASGKALDGIFTAAIYPVSLYYVTANNVYNTIFFTVPAGELPDWEALLNRCVSSIAFSDNFVRGFYNEEQTLANTIRANAKVYSEMSDIITKGWEERQSTYDIISQKQSDATLGYERVYDTETHEVYKAYNGFTDDYSGDRYKPVTDNMYNLPTAGYIEKAR